MPTPVPDELLRRIRALPGIAAVLPVLGPEPESRVALVGGAVRDLLLGSETVDLDLVVEEPIAALAMRLPAATSSYDRFATLTLETSVGRIDIAQARRESYPYPGALPVVEPATLEADLERRDFTVNALAVPLTGDRAGAVIAHAAGLEDLERRRLAVLHPRSFSDDPTRLLRLACYRGRLGFEIAPETRELAAQAVAAGALDTVSGTRSGRELRLLAAEPEPIAAFAALAELGLDAALAPGFGVGAADGATAQTLRNALAALPADGRPDLLALAVAARELEPAALRALLDRLAFTAADRDRILDVATAERLIPELSQARTPAQIGQVLSGSSSEAIAVLSAIASEDDRRSALRWLTELRHLRLAVSGEDLLEAGVGEGPAVGVGLRAAYAAMLDGKAEDREQQLAVGLAAARRELASEQ